MFLFFKSCHAGWTGPNCTQCVPLVGCNATRGGCIRAMECICHEGWKGPLCGEPICSERCALPYGRCSVCIDFIVDISKQLKLQLVYSISQYMYCIHFYHMIRKTLPGDVSAKKGGLEMIVTFASHILAV